MQAWLQMELTENDFVSTFTILYQYEKKRFWHLKYDGVVIYDGNVHITSGCGRFRQLIDDLGIRLFDYIAEKNVIFAD